MKTSNAILPKHVENLTPRSNTQKLYAPTSYFQEDATEETSVGTSTKDPRLRRTPLQRTPALPWTWTRTRRRMKTKETTDLEIELGKKDGILPSHPHQEDQRGEIPGQTMTKIERKIEEGAEIESQEMKEEIVEMKEEHPGEIQKMMIPEEEIPPGQGCQDTLVALQEARSPSGLQGRLESPSLTPRTKEDQDSPRSDLSPKKMSSSKMSNLCMQMTSTTSVIFLTQFPS